jgi:hypothetical protein
MRGYLIQAGAGVLAFGALVYTARNFTLSREGHVTDRYTKAIEQLGSDQPDVRLGAIYALERIMIDSARDHATIVEVLAAYVRAHSPYIADPDEPQDPDPAPRSPDTDVLAAVQVLSRRPRGRPERGPVNLRGTYLAYANLEQLNLSGADLIGAYLVYTSLTQADLSGAILIDAHLRNATLVGCDLTRANLYRATLTGAVAGGACLAHANLNSADLESAHLYDAKLTEAAMIQTILRRANLEEADLTGADLTGADLSDAHLYKANLTGANLTDVSLTGEQRAAAVGVLSTEA